MALVALDTGGKLDLEMMTLVALLCPCVVDQDVAHQPRRQREKMRAIVNVATVDPHDLDHHIVYKIACRKRDIIFPPQLGRGDLRQFGMKPRNQVIARLKIALAPASQQRVGASIGAQSENPVIMDQQACFAINANVPIRDWGARTFF